MSKLCLLVLIICRPTSWHGTVTIFGLTSSFCATSVVTKATSRTITGLGGPKTRRGLLFLTAAKLVLEAMVSTFLEGTTLASDRSPRAS